MPAQGSIGQPSFCGSNIKNNDVRRVPFDLKIIGGGALSHRTSFFKREPNISTKIVVIVNNKDADIFLC
jgi:hypothetical protein